MILYRNNLKNREFGKKAPQIFDSERVTIAKWQGTSENQKFGVRPTQPKTDSSGCFGIKKDFYFVRHGQTNHNIKPNRFEGNLPEDIDLNETGKVQAKAIEPLIASLPIATVCASPMKRAQQTKDIITTRLEAPHHRIAELTECTAEIWYAMTALGMSSSMPPGGHVRLFMDRVREGINSALSLPGPSLIVAHGGIHWALCCLMAIESHDWSLDNCGVVHFSFSEHNNKWTAKKL